MKSKFLNYLAVVGAAALLAACSAATPDDKEERLEALKAQQADLTKEIQKLEAEIAKENPASVAEVKAKDVGVTELVARSFDHYIQTQGAIESENNTTVSSRAMGVVTSVYVKEGDQVTKGQVLAQIDNSVILRSIESMKAQLNLATSVYERQKNLWEQKIGTEVQYLQAKTNKESLEKQLASVEEQNDMTRIKSPINGTVDQLWVKAGENTMPGMPAVRVVNNSELKLTVRISEAYISKVQKNDKVVLQVPGQDNEITARLTFVGKTIDPLSRTFSAEATLPSNPDLRTNMSASVKIIFHTEPNSIVVPVNVIQEINDEKIVYIAEPKGNQLVATRKVISVAGVYGSQAEVKGLESGDKLITVGFQGLNDGDFVKI